MDTLCTTIKLQGSVSDEQTWEPREGLIPTLWSLDNAVRQASQLCQWGDKEAMQRKLLKLRIQGHGPEKSKKAFNIYHCQHSTTMSLKHLLQTSAFKGKHNEVNIWQVPSMYQAMCLVVLLLLFYLLSRQFCQVKSISDEETEVRIGVTQMVSIES